MPYVGAERLAAAGLELLHAIEVPAAGVRLLGSRVSGDGGSAAAAREERSLPNSKKRGVSNIYSRLGSGKSIYFSQMPLAGGA